MKKRFIAEVWYIDKNGDKDMATCEFDSYSDASVWRPVVGRDSVLAATVRVRGFTPDTAWVSFTGMSSGSCTVNVDGVGRVNVELELPQSIKDQIAEFYSHQAYQRIRAQLDDVTSPAIGDAA